MNKFSDRELGMDRSISRRDFVHGASAMAMAFAVGGAAKAAGQAPSPVAYPPARTGLQGSAPGSFEVAHALALGGRTDWGPVTNAEQETYDLIVVGAGISGLAAAHFFRARKPDARILILENHNDFGGHARRNEFLVGERTLLGHGGSQTLQEPARYSSVARRLLADVGVDLERFDVAFHHDFFTHHGLAAGVYFDRATFGTDRVVRYFDPTYRAFLPIDERAPSILEAVREFPLEEAAREQLRSLYSGALAKDFPDWRKFPLATMSYLDLLRRVGSDHPQVLQYLDGMMAPLVCLGIDAVPALWALGFGMPGPEGARSEGLSEPYIHHFPDGNASVARLLVRRLIPEAVPGGTMEDVVTAAARYDQLDVEGRPVRLRLESTVIHVAHLGAPATATEVEVVYVRNGRAERVVAKGCVLACYNMVIPHICPDLPEEQKAALSRLVKSPLVYTNVALRNWHAWKRLGIAAAYCPGRWHHTTFLDFPVSLGDYVHAQDPDDPVVVHMDWEPRSPGQSVADQFRQGRRRLLETSFSDIEREVREHLAGMLGGADFDPATEIVGLTVNRWPHGYAPSPGQFEGGGVRAHIEGRKAIGRITVANSDAGASAYLDAAIDQAARAVGEL